MLDKVSRDLLYEECKGCHKEHTVFWMTLELLKLKASNGWPDTSFSTLLELLTKLLPKPNDFPSGTYQGKKIICALTLGIENIHAYPNIASYTEKICVQRAMLVDTNEAIVVRRSRMTPTKRVKKARTKEEECHSQSGH
jgi:hypothetical protein